MSNNKTKLEMIGKTAQNQLVLFEVKGIATKNIDDQVEMNNARKNMLNIVI